MKPWKQKLDRISSEITNNGIFDVSMNYQPGLIHEFNAIIKKMLITSYKYPHP